MSYINYTVPIELRLLTELDSRAITRGDTLNDLINRILRKDMDEYRADNLVVLQRSPLGRFKDMDGKTWVVASLGAEAEE